jgi:hypothetical protein
MSSYVKALRPGLTHSKDSKMLVYIIVYVRISVIVNAITIATASSYQPSTQGRAGILAEMICYVWYGTAQKTQEGNILLNSRLQPNHRPE